MPSAASFKQQQQANADSSAESPTRQAFKLLEHKIRNLEKRKVSDQIVNKTVWLQLCKQLAFTQCVLPRLGSCLLRHGKQLSYSIDFSTCLCAIVITIRIRLLDGYWPYGSVSKY